MSAPPASASSSPESGAGPAPLWRELASSEAPDPQLLLKLRQHQAVDLHETLPLTNFATASACGVLAWLFILDGAPLWELIPWVVLGGGSAVLRLVLWRWYGRSRRRGRAQDDAQRFLGICMVANLMSGSMFGWGWWALVPEDAPLFTAYLLCHVAFIYGALYAYSTLWGAYLGYVLTGIVPAVAAAWRTYWFDPTPWGWSPPVGLMLVGMLSLMFALRTSRLFRSRFQLEDRVFRLLAQVTRKRDDAINATLDKSRFLAAVSHDLRQPMQAVNLYLASLSRSFEQQQRQPDEPGGAQAVRASIELLQESTRYLNTMFESLLDISRLDAGAVKVELKHSSLIRMVAQLEAEYQRIAEVEGLSFSVELPRQFHLMEVRTDPAQLDRLLRNLIVNALRYTERGGVRLSIVARQRSLDFRVVDTGPGIAREVRERIFEEFFQVPGSQQKRRPSSGTGRGMGLGLAIANRLALRLETTIRLHSVVGRGSVFAVAQPMRIALKPAVDLGEAGEPQTPLNLASDCLVVLIDDDPNVLRSIRIFMESMGATVVAALHSRQAIANLASHNRAPDLILSDWRLGSEDGVECIARLREEFNSDIPAILITGDTSIEHMTLFSETGLRVLHKPVSGEQLISAIQTELLSAAKAAPGQAGP